MTMRDLSLVSAAMLGALVLAWVAEDIVRAIRGCDEVTFLRNDGQSRTACVNEIAACDAQERTDPCLMTIGPWAGYYWSGSLPPIFVVGDDAYHPALTPQGDTPSGTPRKP